MEVIGIGKKFDLINDLWSPRIIAELNGQYVKLAKIKGELTWHSHDDEDEMFMVIKGTLIMEFRHKVETVREGEILVVPRGVEHLPKTDGGEAHILLFEPKSTLHTGNVNHEFTNNDQQWI